MLLKESGEWLVAEQSLLVCWTYAYISMPSVTYMVIIGTFWKHVGRSVCKVVNQYHVYKNKRDVHYGFTGCKTSYRWEILYPQFFCDASMGIPKWWFYGMHDQSCASEYSKCLRNRANGRTTFTCLLDVCIHGILFVRCGMMCSAHLEQLLDSSWYRMLGDVGVWYKYW